MRKSLGVIVPEYSILQFYSRYTSVCSVRCFTTTTAVCKQVQQSRQKDEDGVDIGFNDPREVYQQKSTLDLVRAFGVFNVCRIQPIVRNADSLIHLGKIVAGKNLVNSLVKKTFFGHFCAGETLSEVEQRLQHLNAHGVGGILDYGAEDDVGAVSRSTHEHNDTIIARTYDYEGEIKCDSLVQVFKKSIEAAELQHGEGFAAIKVTALGNPELLKRVSLALTSIKNLFSQFDRNADGFISPDEFEIVYQDLFDEKTSKSELESLFKKWDILHNKKVDYVAFTEALQLSEMPNLLQKRKKNNIYSQNNNIYSQNNNSDVVLTPENNIYSQNNNSDVVLTPENYVDSQKNNFYSQNNNSDVVLTPENNIYSQKNNIYSPKNNFEVVLTPEELELVEAMIARVGKLAKLAAEKNVHLMVDAEHSYFQPAIDHIVAQLQRKYNKQKAVIYNTYQCYLKDSFERVNQDIERARRGNYFFAAKLVRGAYMVLGRRRAEEMGYESPIHDTIQDTHDNYNKILEVALKEVKKSSGGVQIMVASHNQQSIELAISLMNQLDLAPASSGVFFGQLLGMADHLTFSLGRHGYRAYKYVTFGPVEEVIPYLVRRAQENSGLLSGAQLELQLIKNELWRRTMTDSQIAQWANFATSYYKKIMSPAQGNK